MSTVFKLDKVLLTEYAAEVMVYFEKHKLLDISSRLLAEVAIERPDDVEFWMGTNLPRIAHDIYSKCLQSKYDECSELVKMPAITGRFLHRIVIFGRRGSGRKTMAVALMKQFNLLYIDAEQLIKDRLSIADDPAAKQLQQAFDMPSAEQRSQALGPVVAKRLLQMDALRRGWVIVNYPMHLADFQDMFERSKIPPNKLIYLKCPELLGKRRLIAQPDLGRPQDNCNYIEEEMNDFNSNEEKIDEYLSRRYETILVDATPCYEAVRTSVMANVQKVPYMMGLKPDFR